MKKMDSLINKFEKCEISNKLCLKCNILKNIKEFKPKRNICLECFKPYMKELQSNWYENNKRKIRENYNLRYNIDIDFKIEKNYRRALIRFIKNEQKKSIYINFDKNLLLKWLCFNFEENMNLENYTKNWVIDHVIPLNEIKTDKTLFNLITNWNNISPVSLKYNTTKNKYKDKNQIKKHKIKLENFYFENKIKPDIIYLSFLENQI